MSEQRRFSRIAFDAEVDFTHNGRHWQGEVVDISLKGLMLTQPADWAGWVGDPVNIEIILGDDLSIYMDGRVAHVGKGSIGFTCDHIDLDSIAHLRRLIELNLGSSDLLDREFSSLHRPEENA